MADSNTPNITLVQQVNGENDSTWGDKVDANFGKIDKWLGLSLRDGIIGGHLVASVNASALTIAIKAQSGNDPSSTEPVIVPIRNATLATGSLTSIELTAATSLVISSGSTMGATASTAFRLWVLGFNDGGTFRLGALLENSSTNLDEGALRSATAEGGSGGADSANTAYAGAGITSKAFRILGYMDWSSGLGTPGTWSAGPTTIQSMGPGVAKQVPASALTEGDVAYVGTANIFTADQTIQSSDAGSGVGPLLTLHRNSASPADADTLGRIIFSGKNSAAEDTTYGSIYAFATDVTDGTEDARMIFTARSGGTNSICLNLSAGGYMNGESDPGAGNFAAASFVENGTALSSKYFLASSAGSLATTDTINNSDWSGTDLAVENGGTGASTPAGARSALELGSLATASTVNNGNWSGTDLAVANGGTGASSLSGLLRGNGTSAITGSATINNGDWSGTDLSVANGGTGASTLSGLLRGNGTSAITGSSTINNDDWSGADLAVANGGTGASTAQDAANNTVGQVATQASAAGSALGVDGSGNVKKYSVANVLAAMGTTKGNILYHNGTAWTVLAPP